MLITERTRSSSNISNWLATGQSKVRARRLGEGRQWQEAVKQKCSQCFPPPSPLTFYYNLPSQLSLKVQSKI